MGTTIELIDREEQIKTVLEERISSIHDKNLQGVLDLYAPDVVSFDIGEPLQNNGIETIKTRLENWFASYQSPINQEMSNLVVSAGEEVAFCSCLGRTHGTSIKGEKFDMWYRVTTGFRKFGDKWLITHDHVSEPIDLKTGKGLFDLKPQDESNGIKTENRISLSDRARMCYHAYESKDRKAIEDLLSIDFTFTSPNDNRIDKITYLERCWPFSEENPVYEFEKMLEEGNEVLVIYKCTTKNQKTIKNTERIIFEGQKIKSIEVYFGNSINA